MLDVKPAIGRIFRIVPAALVLALAVALAGCDSAERTKSSVSAAKPAVQPVAVNSIAQSLEQMKGKVVVLDLWAT